MGELSSFSPLQFLFRIDTLISTTEIMDMNPYNYIRSCVFVLSKYIIVWRINIIVNFDIYQSMFIMVAYKMRNLIFIMSCPARVWKKIIHRDFYCISFFSLWLLRMCLCHGLSIMLLIWRLIVFHYMYVHFISTTVYI